MIVKVAVSTRNELESVRANKMKAHHQAHRRFVVQAVRHSAATREQVDVAVTSFVGCFGRLWRVPWENRYKEVFWSLAVNGVRAAGACQRRWPNNEPHALVVLWAQVPMGTASTCGSMLSGSVRSQAVCTVLGGALLQQWHLWLVVPPPSVCEIVWRVVCWLLSGQWSRVGNACCLWLIRLLGTGLLCSRPFPKLPPPSDLPCMFCPGMIGQSQLRSRIKSAQIILSCLFASRFPCAHAWWLCFRHKH
jgi:hypothetical protein